MKPKNSKPKDIQTQNSIYKVLIIDNFDSFTYNLYQYFGQILESFNQPFKLIVKRNNQIDINEIKKVNYTHIILSPGPGDPSDESYFGVCKQVLLDSDIQASILGVCLGMQGIGHYFGGKVVRAQKPMHGKTSLIQIFPSKLFMGLKSGLEVMRYHSLVVQKDTLPRTLKIIASSLDSQEIMGLEHKSRPILGIQFHPESFATEGGRQILFNFLRNY